jgi:anti-anti-sigma factor
VLEASALPPITPDEGLRVRVNRSGRRAVIRLDGELDCASAPRLQSAIDELFAHAAPERVLVDAEGLGFLDVAGLRPLLNLRQYVGDGGLALRNARQPIVRVLRLLDLADDLGLDSPR